MMNMSLQCAAKFEIMPHHRSLAMEDTSLYSVGSEISLELSNGQRLKATIVEIIATTLSCVMLIRLGPHSEKKILKLYDRRTAKQLRRDEEIGDWDARIESQYRQYLSTGQHIAHFERWFTKFRSDPTWDAAWDDDEDCDRWGPEIKEAYAHFHCLRAYAIETCAYDRMRDLQGVHVPILFDKVLLRDLDGSSRLDMYSGCPGVLLQYIEGVLLTDIADHLPRSDWQHVCDNAISIIHKIGDRGICNRDVKTRSFIVTKDSDQSAPKPVMVDFGMCLFREGPYKDQSLGLQPTLKDNDFRRWQAEEEEECAIGGMMEKYLKGGYKYEISPRAASLMHEFMREGLND